MNGVAIWLNVALNDPLVAFLYVKVQVRELVRVVDIVAPFAQQGVGRYLEQIRFIKPQGVNRHMRSVPGAPSSGTPQDSQEKINGQNRVGIVEGSSGYRARGVKVQIRDLVRVVEIVAPLPHGGRYTGKSVQAPGCK